MSHARYNAEGCDCLDFMDRGTELFMKFAEPTAALTRKGRGGRERTL